ncbi:hypothetical protein GCM10022247_23450 [Allokutzneria multivorans]|uniref:Uncharacterized protein n=1 Tax=Allokutzneria multivorans TaxID=1142134 RepID=A0ABP7RTX5_9PSEU
MIDGRRREVGPGERLQNGPDRGAMGAQEHKGPESNGPGGSDPANNGPANSDPANSGPVDDGPRR